MQPKSSTTCREDIRRATTRNIHRFYSSVSLLDDDAPDSSDRVTYRVGDTVLVGWKREEGSQLDDVTVLRIYALFEVGVLAAMRRAFGTPAFGGSQQAFLLQATANQAD